MKGAEGEGRDLKAFLLLQEGFYWFKINKDISIYYKGLKNHNLVGFSCI